MVKLKKADEATEELFFKVRKETSINDWVEFVVRSSDSQKELFKVMKSNEIWEDLSDGINFAVIINEVIFDQLTKEQQLMAINECLAGISVSDKDVLSCEKPDFSTYRGILEKYGHLPIIGLHESIVSLFQKKKQEEDEQKAAQKAKKKKFRG